MSALELELEAVGRELLDPTPGRLADLLHVELSTGPRTDTTYGTATYGANEYGGAVSWERWECDITELRLERGRFRALERNAPGVCTFIAVGPIPPGWIDGGLPTGRPARIVTVDGRVIFAGLIEIAGLVKEWGASQWDVTVLDDLSRLGRLELGTLTRPVEDLGARVDALLGLASMLPLGQRWSRNVQAVNGSQRKLLDELGIAVDSWRFQLVNTGAAALVDRRGAFTVTGPTAPGSPPWNSSIYPWFAGPETEGFPGLPPAPSMVGKVWLGDPLAVNLAADLADVRNHLTFANTGGTAVVTTDATSIGQYGGRTYQRMDLIAADGGAANAAAALATWAQYTLEPVPLQRLKSLTFDCWNRPAGAPPLLELLAELDVGHSFAMSLPAQDDTGGRWTVDNQGARILGLAWELAEREAILTLTVDAPIFRRPL